MADVDLVIDQRQTGGVEEPHFGPHTDVNAAGWSFTITAAHTRPWRPTASSGLLYANRSHAIRSAGTKKSLKKRQFLSKK